MTMSKQILSLLLGGLPFALCAQEYVDTTAQAKQRHPLVLQYSLVDQPFQQYAGRTYKDKVSTDNAGASGSFSNVIRTQSPQQAIEIGTDVAMAGHWGVSRIPLFRNNEKLRRLGHFVLSGGFDIAMLSLPLGSGWMHEEGHRAVMANSYTSSYNPFGFTPGDDASGDGLHAVSQVLDTNLVLMKARDNANFVRLHTMGGEMQIKAVSSMQQTVFFHTPFREEGVADAPIHAVYYLFNVMNVSSYMQQCGKKDEATESTLDQMEREGDRQDLRDFTGLDFSAWAYDLARPTEAYSARGLNPYGNGYDRYIYGQKLTDEEYEWITNEGSLALINLLSPANVLFNAIHLGDQRMFNASGRYYPTSFGSQIGLEVMYRTERFNLMVAPRLNRNKSSAFPGIEALLYEKPFRLGPAKFLGTARVIAEMQPEDQSFFADSGELAGLVSGTVLWQASDLLLPYLTVEGKSAGWVAGNAFLDERFAFRFGLSTRFGWN